MDEIDAQDVRNENLIPHLIRASKKPEGPQPNGRCHFCDELVGDTQRWCDALCRDAFERERTAKRG